MEQPRPPTSLPQPDTGTGEAAPAEAGGRKVRWYRRVSAHTGLQGKLVLCFMFLLTAALGSSCWLFATETRDVMDHVAGEQAVEMSRTLALASETPLDRGDKAELDRVGTDLMKNKGLVAVAFFNAAGDLVSVASRDPELDRGGAGYLPNPRQVGHLMQLEHGTLPSLGSYVRLTTPVVRQRSCGAAGRTVATSRRNRPPPAGRAADSSGTSRSACRRATTSRGCGTCSCTVVLIGAVAVLVSLPVMYWLVHRVFPPDPPARRRHRPDRRRGIWRRGVAIDRPDVIGTLARSFNEMVKQRPAASRTTWTGPTASWPPPTRNWPRPTGSLSEANRKLEK